VALKLGCEALSGPSPGDALECPLLSSASRQSSGMPDWVNDAHTQLLAVPEEQELLSGDDRSVPHCSPLPSMPVSEAGDMLNGSAEDPSAFLMRGSDAGSDNDSTSGGVIVTANYTYCVKGSIDPEDNTKLQLRLRIRPEEGMPLLLQDFSALPQDISAFMAMFPGSACVALSEVCHCRDVSVRDLLKVVCRHSR
jgi:hypothetical protein